MSGRLWLKVSVDLPRHAKLFRLARALNISRRDAFYYVFNLWRFTFLNYPDGFLPDDPDEIAYGSDLDSSLEPRDFVQALVSCSVSRSGFLDKIPGGFHVHDWEQFTGEAHDRREYYKEYRRRKREEQSDTAHSSRTVREHVRATCETLHVHPLEEEEEGEEEKNQNHCPPAQTNTVRDDGTQKIEEPANGTPPKPKISDKTLCSEFEELWKLYPRKRSTGKQKALKCYISHRRKGIPMEEFRRAIVGYVDYLMTNCVDSQFTMMASTFFGPSLRWKDYIDDDVQLEYGGMMEPQNNDKFASEKELIQNVFGGDSTEYAKWLSAGSPEPAREWYERRRTQNLAQ